MTVWVNWNEETIVSENDIGTFLEDKGYIDMASSEEELGNFLDYRFEGNLAYIFNLSDEEREQAEEDFEEGTLDRALEMLMEDGYEKYEI